MNTLTQYCFGIIFIIGFVISSNLEPQAVTNGPTIHVHKAWARATPPNAKNTAVYMVLQNSGPANELLLEVKTPVATVVEIHTAIYEKGMISMRRLENLSIPAQGSTTLKPGSTHMMLFGLKGPLKTGTYIDLSLHFKHAEKIQLRVPVIKREKDILKQHKGASKN